MLKKNDGLIDWSRDAEELECLIRGLDPWPSAFCFHNKKRLRLFSPEVVYKDTDEPPGSVLHSDKRGLLVACGKNGLLIREIQPEGKKRMDCFSGVSGDMLLGALVHCGLNQDYLKGELAKLHLEGLEFQVEEKNVNAISSIKVHISSQRRQELRTLPMIDRLLEASRALWIYESQITLACHKGGSCIKPD